MGATRIGPASCLLEEVQEAPQAVSRKSALRPPRLGGLCAAIFSLAFGADRRGRASLSFAAAHCERSAAIPGPNGPPRGRAYHRDCRVASLLAM